MTQTGKTTLILET